MVPGVSVVIPVYNSESTLKCTLESLANQTRPPEEIVVVDDCSTDSSAEICSEFSDVRLVSLKKNSGPAVARNRGVSETSEDIVLFVDADVVLPKDLIGKVMVDFRNRPGISAIQTLYHPKCPAEDIWSRYQNFYYHYHISKCSTEGSAVFSTYCVAVKRSVFAELGGFDTSVPEPTVEDEEFGYDLSDSGYTIFMDRDLHVKHLARYGAGSFLRRRIRMSCAQIKNGMRNLKGRLGKKYASPSRGGTHHPPGMVLGIPMVWTALILFLAGILLSVAGTGPWRELLILSGSLIFLTEILNLPFLLAAAREFGASALFSYGLLILLDILALGAGIIKGFLEFLVGRRY